MYTINLSAEDLRLLNNLLSRINRQAERPPVKRSWIKADGCMINLETGSKLDIVTNKFI